MYIFKLSVKMCPSFSDNVDAYAHIVYKEGCTRMKDVGTKEDHPTVFNHRFSANFSRANVCFHATIKFYTVYLEKHLELLELNLLPSARCRTQRQRCRIMREGFLRVI